MKHFITFLCGSVLLLTSHAEAQYWYAGVTQTARLAYHAEATINIIQQPSKSLCKSPCHVIAWIALWDRKAADKPSASGAFVEMGVGLQTGTLGDTNLVTMWYTGSLTPDLAWRYGIAWPAKTTDIIDVTPDTAAIRVPLNTPVRCTLDKNDGEEFITARWYTNTGGTPKIVTRIVPVPGWVNGPGVHPVNYEVAPGYKYKIQNGLPRPVNITFTGVTHLTGDVNAFLEADPPYTISGTLTDFTVGVSATGK